jgi:hypothetical protein
MIRGASQLALPRLTPGDEYLCIRVGPEASDDHAVQHRLQAAIALSTESMVNGLSAWLSRRGRDRCRAGVAGEDVCRPEPARITNFDEQLGSSLPALFGFGPLGAHRVMRESPPSDILWIAKPVGTPKHVKP